MKKTIALFILSIPLFSHAGLTSQDTPKCEEVGDTIEQILDNRTKETGIDFSLKDVFVVREIKEKGQDKDSRSCYALLQTETYNKLEILYSIWVENHRYFVEITDANPIIDAEIMAKSTEELQNNLGEDKLKSFEMAKKHSDMKEACLALEVAKGFFLNAHNEQKYLKVNNLLKENCNK